MSNCEELSKVNNSVENNEVSADVVEKVIDKTGVNLICGAGKSYYNYLNSIKSEELSGGSDYCTVFMML